MLTHPVIRRELRAALRRRHLQTSRITIAAIACGICVLCMLFSLTNSSTAGRTMHQLLFLLAVYAAVILPAGDAVGLLSDERSSQTLELLFLAGMTSLELFFTKLIGGLLVAATRLLAIAPVLAVPMLAGGVSFDLFVATIATLPALMLFTVAMSMLASVVCQDDSMAMFLTAGLICLLSALTPVPYFLGQTLTGTAPFSHAWLVLSPAFAPWIIGMNAAVPAHLWLSIGATLAWALAALLVAASVLNRTWRTNCAAAQAPWRQAWQDFVRGSHDVRAGLRQNVLPWKPFEWLVRSDRKPQVTAGLIMIIVSALWLIGWAAWPAHWPSTPSFFLTAVILIGAVDLVAIHAAARQFAEARRTGVFEVLLTTPLSTSEIADGLTEGVREQLRPLRRILLLLCLVMAVGGLACRSWTTAGLITYAIVWALLIKWALSALPAP